MSVYTIEKSDCLDAAATNLSDLLDVICEIEFDRAPNSPSDRRIDSLLWIARDLAQGIAKRTAEGGRI